MRFLAPILWLLASTLTSTQPAAPSPVRMRVDAIHNPGGTWSCFLTVLNLSDKTIEVPSLPARVSIRRTNANSHGDLAGAQVILQRGKGTRQIAPDEGFVTRLPVTLAEPGSYEIEVFVKDGIKIDAAVTVPTESTD